MAEMSLERSDCICRVKKESTCLLYCIICGTGFHMECLGLTRNEVKKLTDWKCFNCADNDIAQKTRSKCLLIDCTNYSRNNSKYCSDKCGYTLAYIRMNYLIPKRLEQYKDIITKEKQCLNENVTSVNTEIEKHNKSLERLGQMTSYMNHFRNFLRKEFEKSPKMNFKKSDDKKITSELLMSCPTCGYEINGKIVLKHMLKCTSKIEALTTLTSPFNSDSNIFCNFYYKQSSVYCRRLKVLCPEHQAKNSNKNILCGFYEDLWYNCVTDWNQINQFEQLISRICLNDLNHCNEHFNWQLLKQAEVDLEKFKLLTEIESLKLNIKIQTESFDRRWNILALILNETIVH